MAEAFWKDVGMKLTLWGPLSPLALTLAVLVFATDQAHKWWMLNVLDINEKKLFTLTPFLDLILVWNQGISYGLLTTHAQGLLIGISLIITVVLWIWSCRSTRPLAVAALGLVIGGALGNALDRYLYGAVADFFHLHWGSLSWYVFNVADVAIVAGVALLLYESFKERSAA
jgi:signal peptidase II